MATTADVRNPFAFSDQEPMDESPLSGTRAGIPTVRTLGTHELEDDMPDFDGDDDLEMVPTPQPTGEVESDGTQAENESPGDLEPPSPPPGTPFQDDEVPPPPTMEAVPVSQQTRTLVREEVDDDLAPLAELARPVATQVLSGTPVPKGSVAKALRPGIPPIPDLTEEQMELLNQCFHGLTDVPTGNAHSHNFHMLAYLMTDPEDGTNVWVTPHPAIMGCVLTGNDPQTRCRFTCRFCRKDKGGGKGGVSRFTTPGGCLAHLHEFHLYPHQIEELKAITRTRISLRQVLAYYLKRDVLRWPLPMNTDGLLPQVLPDHPKKKGHNPHIM
eukprot:4778951-Amphidinium_carterae.1